MVHHLLEALAEGTPSDAWDAVLGLREGDRPDARRHPELLHHGVGDARDLPQVVLRRWSEGSEKGVLSWRCRSRHPGPCRPLRAEEGTRGQLYPVTGP